jgi:uncharacterized protein with ParB-like and HNH nuclease domain
MGLNNEIQPSRANIAEFSSKMLSGQYYVDRSFQRRLVWTNKQKVRLIETVLIEYPMPEVYLWEQPPDAETGLQKFSIVDGQQRLSTLRQFLNNEWPLKKSFLDEERRNSDYADKFWKDLSQKQKTDILQYNINFRRIPSTVDIDEIRLIFARLNETDRSLNPQEMRNATLNGDFLNASAQLADSLEMGSLNIFSSNDVRRMLDVEFASQLLGYERQGIVNDTPEAINDLYDKYSDNYKEANEDIRKVKARLSTINELFKDPKVRSFFESQIAVYTLNALLDIEQSRTVETWVRQLSEFAAAYEAPPSGAANTPASKYLEEYKTGVSSRTRSRSSRTLRLFALRNWIRANLGEPIAT